MSLDRAYIPEHHIEHFRLALVRCRVSAEAFRRDVRYRGWDRHMSLDRDRVLGWMRGTPLPGGITMSYPEIAAAANSQSHTTVMAAVRRARAATTGVPPA